MKKIIAPLTVFLPILLGCGAEQQSQIQEDDTVKVDSASLLINEFCFKAKGKNEFGAKADWLEIYNPTSSEIVLEPGKWTISDDPSNTEKYYIPEVTIEAGGYLVMWCDDQNIQLKEIHTNFKLSSKGESINLFYEEKLIDQHVYDSSATDFKCKCRTKDGGADWQYTNDPTRGSGNAPSL